MSLLLPDCLLVLSLLFVRPVPDRAWPRRLMLHALLLAVCLVGAVLAPDSEDGPGKGLRVVALAASLVQLAVQLLFVHGRIAGAPGPAGAGDTDGRLGGAIWLPAGLALVALSIRIVPDPVLPHGLLTVSVATLLTGLLGTVAAGSAIGRIGSLLLAGDALVLAASRLHGMDLLSLCAILLLQAGLLLALVRACAAGDAEAAS
jgi:hypothetical protein